MRTMFFKTLTLLAIVLSAFQAGAQWKTENIGRNPIGSVIDNGSGSFSFTAGGNDIWDNIDELTYHYQEIAGDFDVRVRVESVAPNARWTKAGLMVRESLAEDSRMLFPRVTPANVPTSSGGNGANDMRFSYRTGNDESTGGFGDDHNGGRHEDIDPATLTILSAPPYPNAWLRLTRAGGVFTAYNSADGATWNLLGAQDTALWQGGAAARTLLVGLGAARHSGGATAAVEFRDYSLTQSTLAVADANSRGNPTGVRVSYSGTVPAAGLVAGNYALDNGATVSSAAAGPGNTVQLTTSALTEGTTYTLTVTGVGTSPDPAAITFVHGAGFEVRNIHLHRNQILNDQVDIFLGSTAYRLGLPVSCQSLPAAAGVALFEDPTPSTGDGQQENYSVKTHGILNITVAGDYRFAVSSDDQSRLFISTDENPANKVEIAREPAWNGVREYITGANQAPRGTPAANISALINLAVGRYYLEQSASEGGGGNNSSTTWQPPGAPAIANGSLPIDQANFIPSRSYHGNIFSTLGPVTIVHNPTPATARAGVAGGARFTVHADGTPDYTYQWKRNGVNIPGATSKTYTFTALPADDQQDYSVEVSNEFSSASSTSAKLTVITDFDPPTLVSAIASPGVPTAFTLVFNEIVNSADAGNAANYSIDGGVTINSVTVQPDNRSVLFSVSPVNTPGVKTLTVNNVRDQFDNVITANSTIAIIYAEGRIRRHFWKYTGGGGSVGAVTSNARFPSNPDNVSFPTLFEDTQVDNGNAENEQFGVQFLGYITAPFTGNYNFYTSSDDNGALWLSSDENPANKVLIAREPQWNGRRDYLGTARRNVTAPENRSTTLFPGGIPLVAGRRYYIENIFSEGGGGNNMSVAWQRPGDPVPANGSSPITAEYLSPYDVPAAILSGPQDRTVNVGQAASFSITVSGSPLLHATWYRTDGTAADVVVAQGNGLFSYTTGLNRNSDNGATFYVVLSNSVSAPVTSRVATLTVNPDTVPPTLVSSASFNGTSLGIVFDGPMDATTANNPANYSVGGVNPVSATLRADLRSVSLEFAASVGSPFTITVNNVQDFAGNPIAADSTVNGAIWATAQEISPLPDGRTRPNPPGSSAFTGNTGDADVIAGGQDIWAAADEFHFIHNPVEGDFDVKVKVQRLDPSNRWAKAGLMARVALTPDSPTIQVVTTRGGPADGSITEIETGLRTTFGGQTGGWELFRPSLPRPNVWVRLRRNGDTFRGYYGTDGVTWSHFATRTLPGVPAMLNLGLATTSHNIAQNTTAEYRSFSAFTLANCTLTFTQNPQDRTVTSNSPVTFSATVGGNAPVSEVLYQWQRSTDGGATFANIPGAESASYSIPFTSPEHDGNQFRLVASAPGCTATSTAATLTLSPDTTSPRVSLVLGVLNGSNIVVYFSEPMGDATPDAFTFRLIDNATMTDIPITEAPFHVAGGNTNRTRVNVTIDPTVSPIAPGSSLTLITTATDGMGGPWGGATDLAGNPIDPNPTSNIFTARAMTVDPDGIPRLPTNDKLALGSLTERGFDGRSVDIIPGIANANPVAEAMLAGVYRGPDGNLVMNEAPLICWYEPNVINYNNDGGNVGAIPGDVQFPGALPGTDNIAIEVLFHAELTAGVHTWAVNSDDGFRVSPARGVWDPNNNIRLGEFNGGRGAATTEFSFLVLEDGLYPMRLIWQEGGGGMNLEFWSRDVQANTTPLINAAGGVPAFRSPSAQGTLSVTASGNDVVVAWPANQIGCLEGANSITGPWTAIRRSETLTGTTKSIRIPRSQAMQFHRLKRP